MVKIMLGQEVICPDGLGRITAYKLDFPHVWVQVKTYVNDRSCKWDLKNIKLEATDENDRTNRR